MEKLCEQCGGTFTPKHWKRAGRFCSLACYHASGDPRGRKATVQGQRMKSAHGHPIAPPSGIVAVSRLVLFEKLGPGTHPCHWCKNPVTWMAGGGPATPGNLIADHLDWNIHNDDPENLVASCNVCNSHRTNGGGRARIKEGELTTLSGGARTRAVQRFCEQCDAEFLVPPSVLKSGRGRFCSRSCARMTPRTDF